MNTNKKWDTRHPLTQADIHLLEIGDYVFVKPQKTISGYAGILFSVEKTNVVLVCKSDMYGSQNLRFSKKNIVKFIKPQIEPVEYVAPKTLEDAMIEIDKLRTEASELDEPLKDQDYVEKILREQILDLENENEKLNSKISDLEDKVSEFPKIETLADQYRLEDLIKLYK